MIASSGMGKKKQVFWNHETSVSGLPQNNSGTIVKTGNISDPCIFVGGMLILSLKIFVAPN